MKKLLIGLIALGSMSCFANDYPFSPNLLTSFRCNGVGHAEVLIDGGNFIAIINDKVETLMGLGRDHPMFENEMGHATAKKIDASTLQITVDGFTQFPISWSDYFDQVALTINFKTKRIQYTVTSGYDDQEIASGKVKCQDLYTDDFIDSLMVKLSITDL